MAKVNPIVRAELDPSQPVPEICAVISAMLPYHGGQERAVLLGVKEAIERQLAHMEKEGDQVD